MATDKESTPVKKPATKKSSSKKKVPTASAVASAKKPATMKAEATATAAPPRKGLSPEERYRMVEETAYFKALEENFSGDPSSYWAQAEAEIEKKLRG